MAKTKLELTWFGKDKRPRLEPRILLEDPDKSYHAPHRVTENDIFDNRLMLPFNSLVTQALCSVWRPRVASASCTVFRQPADWW